MLGSFFAEGVNIAVVRNDESIIEGYAVYRLGQPEIPVSELVYTTRRAQRALLNYFYNHRSQGTSIRWNEVFTIHTIVSIQMVKAAMPLCRI